MPPIENPAARVVWPAVDAHVVVAPTRQRGALLEERRAVQVVGRVATAARLVLLKPVPP
jgi:hypothetical protein